MVIYKKRSSIRNNRMGREARRSKYISPHPTRFKIGVPHGEKVFVGIPIAIARKENGL
jgi:hypothetical protein